MRKVDKSGFIAKDFLREIKKYDDDGANHPLYESNAFYNAYRTPVKVALVYAQQGICAYTECELHRNYKELKAGFDGNGKWNETLASKGYGGEIDHFTGALKKEKGWLLSNLFAVLPEVNVCKPKKSPPPFDYLNPGLATYDPHDYLFYSFAQHKFFPKTNLQVHLKEQVQLTIDALGLNLPIVHSQRKGYLESFKKDVEEGTKSFLQIKNEHYKFFTAFEMSEDEFKKKA